MDEAPCEEAGPETVEVEVAAEITKALDDASERDSRSDT